MTRSMKLFSPEVVLSLYKFTILPYFEYSCHVWAGASNCYWDMLEKLLKLICRTVAASLAISLKPYIFSIAITLVDVHLNWLNTFYFIILMAGLLIILIGYFF